MNNFKKLLNITLLLIFIFFSGIAYATTIKSLTGAVQEGDKITAEYFNNLNGPKDEGRFCTFSGGRLDCRYVPAPPAPEPGSINYCDLNFSVKCVLRK